MNGTSFIIFLNCLTSLANLCNIRVYTHRDGNKLKKKQTLFIVRADVSEATRNLSVCINIFPGCFVRFRLD